MKNITKYFRDCVATSLNGNINLKNKKYTIISEQELYSGKFEEKRLEIIWKDYLQSKEER